MFTQASESELCGYSPDMDSSVLLARDKAMGGMASPLTQSE